MEPQGKCLADRARAWRHSAQAAICDVLAPWAHGTVVRATRHPDYFDYNVVRIEDDPTMTVDALVAFANQSLTALAHRRIDFDVASAAEPLRAGFEAEGWQALRLLCMRHERRPRRAGIAVERVGHDAVDGLRAAWYREEFPGRDVGDYYAQARDVALRRRALVVAVRDGRAPIAFAELERDREAAEITQVFVHPDYRGAGLGTALTLAAIDAAGDVRDLWIAVDDEDRPKRLYARLGFEAAAATLEFLRPPERR